jgi:quinolinate synthase
MLPEKYKVLSDEETFPRIKKAKKKLGDKLFILGHHYQRDEVIQFVDAVGDSLKLSQTAAKSKSKYIVFCGVSFMAETADIITKDDQAVMLPDLSAGCPMADMAPSFQIETAWNDLSKIIGDMSDFMPITYINTYADTKAFCGKKGGLVCTSANAEKILKWAILQNKKVFFFPDKHLGRNCARKAGFKKDEVFLWDRGKPNGGLTEKQIQKARILRWTGFCPVHDRFKVQDVDVIKKQYPDVKILVHPEVPEQLAKKADYMGSTEYIVRMIKEAPKGSKWAIGTEIHLISRLAKQHPDKKIFVLGTPICMCSMMDRISPQYLLWTLESLVEGKVVNRIVVPEEIAKYAKKALNRMFKLS